MNMAVTIDARPSYFGDRMIVTGTYEAGDGSIDLSGLLISIDCATVNLTGVPGQGSGAVTINLHDIITISGSTLVITEGEDGGVGTQGGKFFAIGRRS